MKGWGSSHKVSSEPRVEPPYQHNHGGRRAAAAAHPFVDRKPKDGGGGTDTKLQFLASAYCERDDDDSATPFITSVIINNS
jgi:hypothetical protein